jgi:hypothetical protein
MSFKDNPDEYDTSKLTAACGRFRDCVGEGEDIPINVVCEKLAEYTQFTQDRPIYLKAMEERNEVECNKTVTEIQGENNDSTLDIVALVGLIILLICMLLP